MSEFIPLKKWHWVSCELKCGWENCSGKHLEVQLPTGHWWDIDGRGDHCSNPNDHYHRCWIKSGRLPNITVGKKGLTCEGGTGSVLIKNPNGHWILQAGKFYSQDWPF